MKFKNFFFFPQHLCYGSPFLPSLTVSWLGAGISKFDPAAATVVVVVIIIVVQPQRRHRALRRKGVRRPGVYPQDTDDAQALGPRPNHRW